MSLYQVQKFVQSVNRDPEKRQRFFDDPEALAADFDLTDAEKTALTQVQVYELYEMGVHPLLLRPFTIINQMSEPDYLKTIRGET